MIWGPIFAGLGTITTVFGYNHYAQKGMFGQSAPFIKPVHLPAITSGFVATVVFYKTRRIAPTLKGVIISLTALALIGIRNRNSQNRLNNARF